MFSVKFPQSNKFQFNSVHFIVPRKESENIQSVISEYLNNAYYLVSVVHYLLCDMNYGIWLLGISALLERTRVFTCGSTQSSGLPNIAHGHMGASL